MMRKTLIFLLGLLCLGTASRAQERPVVNYTITTVVNPTCTSYISLTLFQEGTGNDSLNEVLMEEFLGNFMQSKPLRNLEFFYAERRFNSDSSFDFNIGSAMTYRKNDLLSFTCCPKFACDKEKTSTYETQMATLDAKTGRILELKDFFEPAKMDSLEKLIYKYVTMYRLKNLPTCAMLGLNPNTVQASNGSSTLTDEVTYIRGLTHKFYLTDGRIHLYNKVKHRDYDYEDLEIAMPMTKLLYFLKPEMKKRLGLE